MNSYIVLYRVSKNQSRIAPLRKCFVNEGCICQVSHYELYTHIYLDTIPKIDCPSIILKMFRCPASVTLVSSISIPSMART